MHFSLWLHVDNDLINQGGFCNIKIMIFLLQADDVCKTQNIKLRKTHSYNSYK